MRVLLVAYHFPPSAEVGGVRPYQFARLLPQYGVEPWVLTVTPEFAERLDPGCGELAVPAARIVRTEMRPSRLQRAQRLAAMFKRARGKGAAEAEGEGGDGQVYQYRMAPWKGRLYSWLAYPDRIAGWYGPAVAAGERLVREHGIEAVFSTSPPRAPHLIARHLSAKFRLPWIMDLRDPWIGPWDPWIAVSPALQERYRSLFRACAGQASRVVLNTERLRDGMAAEYPELREKAVAVPNGFDPSLLPSEGSDEPDGFTVGYFGYLMGKRTSKTFLEGLRLWLDRGSADPAQVKARFVGGGFEHDAAVHAARLGLEAQVSLEPPVPREQVPIQLARCYMLLLLANDQPAQVPGKVYEYLGASRRILALTEADGATADLLRAQRGCYLAETPDGVAEVLDAAWREYRSGAGARLDHSGLLEQHTYARRTEALAGLFREVVREPVRVAVPAGARAERGRS